MILTCPSCSTRYQADSARFVRARPERALREMRPRVVSDARPRRNPSRNLRSKPVAPPRTRSDAAALPRRCRPPTLESVVKPARPQMRPPRRSARRSAKGGVLADAIAWAALIFLAVTIGWAAVHYRQTIVELWPGVAPLYEVVGLPVETEGIALTDIAYQHEVEDGQPVLSVMGKVVNVSDRELPVPVIRVMLSDRSAARNLSLDVRCRCSEPETRRGEPVRHAAVQSASRSAQSQHPFRGSRRDGMSAERRERKLYSQAEIARRVKAAARNIARAPLRPEIAVPVLAGAFVFAADLLRALAREGVDLETEFIWLRSYGTVRTAGRHHGLERAGRNRPRQDRSPDRRRAGIGRNACACEAAARGSRCAAVISVVAVKKPYANPLVGRRSRAVRGGAGLHLRLRHGSRRARPRPAGYPRETGIAETRKPPCRA